MIFNLHLFRIACTFVIRSWWWWWYVSVPLVYTNPSYTFRKSRDIYLHSYENTINYLYFILTDCEHFIELKYFPGRLFHPFCGVLVRNGNNDGSKSCGSAFHFTCAKLQPTSFLCKDEKLGWHKLWQLNIFFCL